MHQHNTFPGEIFDIIQEIANLSSEGNYLFRGEPKHHGKISSTLYRECERIVQEAGLESELSDFDIEAIEREIANMVKYLLHFIVNVSVLFRKRVLRVSCLILTLRQ